MKFRDLRQIHDVITDNRIRLSEEITREKQKAMNTAGEAEYNRIAERINDLEGQRNQLTYLQRVIEDAELR